MNCACSLRRRRRCASGSGECIICLRRCELCERALLRFFFVAGLPLRAALGGGRGRRLVKSPAVDTPLGDVARSVGVGSRPSDADARSPSPPRWWGRATPSSVVAATLPSWGGATTARVVRNVHLPVSEPLYWRGGCALKRATCVRVSCARTLTGAGIKDFRDESHGFVRAIEPRLGGASDDSGGSRNRAGGAPRNPAEPTVFTWQVADLFRKAPPQPCALTTHYYLEYYYYA